MVTEEDLNRYYAQRDESALLAALRDDSPLIRSYAAQILGQIRTDRDESFGAPRQKPKPRRRRVARPPTRRTSVRRPPGGEADGEAAVKRPPGRRRSAAGSRSDELHLPEAAIPHVENDRPTRHSASPAFIVLGSKSAVHRLQCMRCGATVAAKGLGLQRVRCPECDRLAVVEFE